MTHRTLVLLLGLCACGPEFVVRPPAGAPHVTATAQGVSMSTFAEQWAGDPGDLADWVTPIAVDLHNGTSTEIRISLADFALRTEQGVRLPALNPFQLPVAELQLKDEGALQTGPLYASTGPLYAQVRVGPPPSMGSRGGGMGFGRGGGFVGPPPARRFGGGGGPMLGPRYGGGYGGGYAYRPRWGPGFYIAGGLRGYYGPGALYWSGPYGYGYGWGYGPYVSYWGGPGSRRGPTPEVIDMAIPDGVLAPGAHINGFLYFQKATGPEVRAVTLTWTPVDVRTSQPVGEARITLEVARR